MAEEKKLSKKEQKAREKAEQKRNKKDAKKKGEENLDDEDEEPGTGGKAIVALVALVIIAIWLAIFALVIKMDVGGFGSTVMTPLLKNVPVLNKILPASEEYAKEDSKYNYDTVADAVARIKELEAELKKAQDKADANQSQIADLQSAQQELQTYKDDQANFEKIKKEFDEKVVFGDKAPDINEYKKYYESIDSDNAAAIYKEVVEQQQADAEIKSYAQTYSQMKPKQAAAIFDTMTDNLSLVAKILNAMDSTSRGNILGAMNADTAAQVTKIMEPSSK